MPRSRAPSLRLLRTHRFCRYPGRRRYLCSIYSFDRITSRDRHPRNCSTSKSCLAQGSADFHHRHSIHLNTPFISYPEQVTVRCQAITGGDNCSRQKPLPLIWWVPVLIETTLQHDGSCPPIKHQQFNGGFGLRSYCPPFSSHSVKGECAVYGNQRLPLCILERIA